MTCTECEALLGPLTDDELDTPSASRVRAHLEECPRCAREAAELQALRRVIREQLPRHEAPDLLRARIVRAVRADARAERAPDATPHAVPSQTPLPWRAIAIAASVLAIASSAWVVSGAMQRAPTAASLVTHDLIASHVRSLMPGHLMDVASTDQHTVKPWFTGRLDYSPTVDDLAAQGFPLEGGRLDYIDGRSVAALVYGRRKHTINLYVWPTSGGSQSPSEVTVNGFHIVHWVGGGMEYWAISDVAMPDLRDFAQQLERVDESGVKEP